MSRTFVRDLRSAPREARDGPRSLCYVRAPGRSRPLSSSPTSSLGPAEEVSPRARVRARSSHHLAPHPRRAAARRQRGHLAHLARARSSLRELDGDDARARGARRRPRVGRRPLRPAAAAPAPRPCSARARASSSSAPRSAAASRAPAPRGASARPPRRSSTRACTFDQFVIGDCNRLAHAAALAVAEMPGLAYNPLFICGPPGLGKTHLLHSIANYVHEHGDGLTVRYTTVEAFTDHFVGALHGGGIDAFKAAYRGVDVLLVDDVQFLAEQGQDRAGVLPHLQRAARGRRPARAHLRPPAARHGRARGPAARALRGRPGRATSARPTSPRA